MLLPAKAGARTLSVVGLPAVSPADRCSTAMQQWRFRMLMQDRSYERNQRPVTNVRNGSEAVTSRGC